MVKCLATFTCTDQQLHYNVVPGLGLIRGQRFLASVSPEPVIASRDDALHSNGQHLVKVYCRVTTPKNRGRFVA